MRRPGPAWVLAAACLGLAWWAFASFQTSYIHLFGFSWWRWGLGVALAAAGGAAVQRGLPSRPAVPTGWARAVAALPAILVAHLPALWVARQQGWSLPGALGRDLAVDHPAAQLALAFLAGVIVSLPAASRAERPGGAAAAPPAATRPGS